MYVYGVVCKKNIKSALKCGPRIVSIGSENGSYDDFSKYVLICFDMTCNFDEIWCFDDNINMVSVPKAIKRIKKFMEKMKRKGFEVGIPPPDNGLYTRWHFGHN